MLPSLALLCLVAFVSFTSGVPTTSPSHGHLPDQELVFAIIVNRHGERTPDSDELSLSDQQEALKNLTAIEGLEGLTNVGKRRAFQIGKFLRERYGAHGHKILSKIYLQDEIAIRSTDKERTKMTAQVAMAALYPPQPEQQWDAGLGKIWQPVPYTAVPLSEDYLRYYSNCQRFKDLIKIAKQEAVHEEFAQFDHLLPLLQNGTGRNFTENPLLFQTFFDLLRSQIALGLDIPDWTKPIFTTLGEAAKQAYRVYLRTDEMKRIGGGVLLKNFVDAATDISEGKKVSKRLRLFSSHDFNIGALMEVAFVRGEESVPEYGAVFMLELYRSRKTGDLSVLPVYLPQAGDSTSKNLYIQDCEGYCSFTKFKDMTKDYLLSAREFYSICDIKTEL